MVQPSLSESWGHETGVSVDFSGVDDLLTSLPKDTVEPGTEIEPGLKTENSYIEDLDSGL